MKDLNKFINERMSKFNNERFTSQEQELIIEDLEEEIEKHIISYIDSFIKDQLSRYSDIKCSEEWIWEE